MNLIEKIVRRLRADTAGRRQGAPDRRRALDCRDDGNERRRGPSDRRQGDRRRTAEQDAAE